jgi:fused signal recognition particle receptor
LWRRNRNEDETADAADSAVAVHGPIEVEEAIEDISEEEIEEIREQTGRAVERTRRGFFTRVGSMFTRADFDDSLWEDLEETLIAADTGLPTTEAILERVRTNVKDAGVKRGDEVRDILREELIGVLTAPGRPLLPWEQANGPRPAVVLVVGVNGAGKTTSIGKLAHGFGQSGARVILAAADTFRAAAIDQLKIWGERAGARVVAHQPGSDPGAIVYDAIDAGQSTGADVVLIDTAGRLHTKVNLMEELKKLRRVTTRLVPEGPHATLLVLDATSGQNGLAQARHFTEAAGVTGIILAKLDGTSKGGIVFAIAHELNLPVLYIGTGEKVGDLAPFSPAEFVDALLG